MDARNDILGLRISEGGAPAREAPQGKHRSGRFCAAGHEFPSNKRGRGRPQTRCRRCESLEKSKAARVVREKLRATSVADFELTGYGPGRPKKGEERPARVKESKPKPEAWTVDAQVERDRANGKHRRRRLKGYGLTEADFDRMMAAQNRSCAICKVEISEATQLAPRYHGLPGYRRIATATTAVVDHCHKTGKVRGLLCLICNKFLGCFKDDPTRIRAAADYVEAANGD